MQEKYGHYVWKHLTLILRSESDLYTYWFVWVWFYFSLSDRTGFSSPSGGQKDTTSSCQHPDHPRWTAGQPYLHPLQQKHTGENCTPQALQGTFKPPFVSKRVISVWLKFLKWLCIQGCGIRRPDAVWHHPLGRKKYQYFLEQPTSLTGAGRWTTPTA